MWLTSYITPKLLTQRKFKIWIGSLKLFMIILSLGVIWVILVWVYQIIWLWLTSYIIPQLLSKLNVFLQHVFCSSSWSNKKVMIFALWFDMNWYGFALFNILMSFDELRRYKWTPLKCLGKWSEYRFYHLSIILLRYSEAVV